MDDFNGEPYDDERQDMDGNYYNGKIDGDVPNHYAYPHDQRRCGNRDCGDVIYYGLYCSNLCADTYGDDLKAQVRFLRADNKLLRSTIAEMQERIRVYESN